MVIPMPPSVIDFASTVSFIDMARTTMAQLERLGGRAKPAYNFIKIVASRVDDSKSMHREILSMMRQVFGGSMINSVLRTSAEIDNASSRMKRSEEHTSELQSLMRISYAVFCLKKKNKQTTQQRTKIHIVSKTNHTQATKK